MIKPDVSIRSNASTVLGHIREVRLSLPARTKARHGATPKQAGSKRQPVTARSAAQSCSLPDSVSFEPVARCVRAVHHGWQNLEAICGEPFAAFGELTEGFTR